MVPNHMQGSEPSIHLLAVYASISITHYLAVKGSHTELLNSCSLVHPDINLFHIFCPCIVVCVSMLHVWRVCIVCVFINLKVCSNVCNSLPPTPTPPPSPTNIHTLTWLFLIGISAHYKLHFCYKLHDMTCHIWLLETNTSSNVWKCFFKNCLIYSSKRCLLTWITVKFLSKVVRLMPSLAFQIWSMDFQGVLAFESWHWLVEPLHHTAGQLSGPHADDLVCFLCLWIEGVQTAVLTPVIPEQNQEVLGGWPGDLLKSTESDVCLPMSDNIWVHSA